jgi:hypothetical protein
VSLALAWLIGAYAVLASSVTLTVVDDTPEELSAGLDRNAELTAEQRGRQKEALEAWATALAAARRRVMPLAVAELLLGASMVIFAQRATVGRPWARIALVQLTAANMALAVAEWMLTPDIRKPLFDLQMALNNLETQEVPVGAPQLVQVALGLGLGAITVVGLTLRGSRAFYTRVDPLTEP